VLHRWTKYAKGPIIWDEFEDEHKVSDSYLAGQYIGLTEMCRRMCKLAAQSREFMQHVRETVANELLWLGEGSGIYVNQEDVGVEPNNYSNLRNPVPVRYKGCSSSSSNVHNRRKRTHRCRKCRQVGHNSTTCTFQSIVDDDNILQSDDNVIDGEDYVDLTEDDHSQ
jgi:hypothetical protein